MIVSCGCGPSCSWWLMPKRSARQPGSCSAPTSSSDPGSGSAGRSVASCRASSSGCGGPPGRSRNARRRCPRSRSASPGARRGPMPLRTWPASSAAGGRAGDGSRGPRYRYTGDGERRPADAPTHLPSAKTATGWKKSSSASVFAHFAGCFAVAGARCGGHGSGSLCHAAARSPRRSRGHARDEDDVRGGAAGHGCLCRRRRTSGEALAGHCGKLAARSRRGSLASRGDRPGGP